MTAEDVAFSFGPERTGWGLSLDQARNLFGSVPGQAQGRTPPPEVLAVARRTYPALERVEIVDAGTIRVVSRVPDLALEGRLTRNTGMIISRAAFEASATWLDWARRPIGTGPFRVVEFRPDQALVLEAFDEYWGGRAPVPRGLQFDFYGPMLHRDWEAPRFDPAEARRLLREAGYKGDPIPYRLLAGYYTNQFTTAQVLVEGWRAVGLNVQIEMRENFPQVLSWEGQRGVRDWSNSASFNDPVSSLTAQHGPEGQQWQIGEWRNEEFGALSQQFETGSEPAERRALFRRMLEIAEREDPAYTVLHQSVSLTAKRRDLRWRAGQSFVMDFRGRNWGA
jgi:ABC-type transport system substrate-binding protein